MGKILNPKTPTDYNKNIGLFCEVSGCNKSIKGIYQLKRHLKTIKDKQHSKFRKTHFNDIEQCLKYQIRKNMKSGRYQTPTKKQTKSIEEKVELHRKACKKWNDVNVRIPKLTKSFKGAGNRLIIKDKILQTKILLDDIQNERNEDNIKIIEKEDVELDSKILVQVKPIQKQFTREDFDLYLSESKVGDEMIERFLRLEDFKRQETIFGS